MQIVLGKHKYLMMKCVSCICLYLSLFKYAELHDCHLLAQYLWASPIVHRFSCEICYRKESIWVEVSCALPIACQQRWQWWCFSITVENIAYWIYESNLSTCWSGNKILWVTHHHFPHGWHASVCVVCTELMYAHGTSQYSISNSQRVYSSEQRKFQATTKNNQYRKWH